MPSARAFAETKEPNGSFGAAGKRAFLASFFRRTEDFRLRMILRLISRSIELPPPQLVQISDRVASRMPASSRHASQIRIFYQIKRLMPASAARAAEQIF